MIACCRFFLHSQLLSCPGGGSGNGHRTQIGFRLPAFGFRICWRLFVLKVPGAGLTDLEARAPEPFLTCGGAESPLAGHRTASFPALLFTALEFRPIPVRRNLVLGIAKLLPQIVPVKRETLQVVSLAMTGLMRGLRPGFPHCGKRRAVAIWRAWARIPILGPYLTAGAGVAAASQRLRTRVSVVPPGRVLVCSS